MAFTHVAPIDSQTRLVGMIGSPTGPWPAPEVYNAAFKAAGLNWCYVPLPTPDGKLREALLGLRALGFVGAQLAEPYQSEAQAHLDKISPAAETIGAVEFVEVNERGVLFGDNIRWLGFLAALRALAPSFNGVRPLIIGAGNVARSVAYALTYEGVPLTIVDERIDRAIDLVRYLRHVMDEHSFSVYRWPHDLARVAPDANVIVNATAIGAWPDVDRSPWPDDLAFPRDALVFDLASWSGETRLLRQAQAGGARDVSGMTLQVYEAALTFEMWTGQPAPIKVMEQAVRAGLTERRPGEIARSEIISLPQPT